MTFLAPALLALGLAVAVPLVLHLLQRHQGPRVVFPALRYLRRAEREHATRIRLRQILLLALRVLALVLLAAAAARPFVRGLGQGHPPTTVVMVLDNSLSSGAVVGDRRMLDELKDAALATLYRAGPGDRVWLIRAGSPWEPAVTGSAATIAEAVRRTAVSPAGADLAEALQRALAILGFEPETRPREIHLLSDLQASALPPPGLQRPDRPTASGDRGDPTVLAYASPTQPPANRAIEAVEAGGGLPPRAGQRSTVAVTLSGNDADADSVAVRLVLDGSVRAAGWIGSGGAGVLPFPARPAGRAAGYVEIDPDALVADDRRYFVVDVAGPTPVAVTGSQSFLDDAVTVLEDAGRLRRTATRDARVVLAPAARSADAVRRGASVIVMPPPTSLDLAATNQRLAGAGIPLRYGPPRPGEARLDTRSMLSGPWADVRLLQVYGLIGEGRDSVELRLQDGAPWAVSGELPGGGRFLLLASPLTAEGGTIPTSAVMVPFLDHLVTGWAAGADRARSLAPGSPITVTGDAVAGPEGVEPVRDGAMYRPRTPGIYHVLSGPDTVAAYAVNPPASESSLERLAPDRLQDRLPGLDVAVAGPGEWGATVFRDRLGQEVTGWLVAVALLILVVEMAVSATGPTRRRDPVAATTPTGAG